MHQLGFRLRRAHPMNVHAPIRAAAAISVVRHLSPQVTGPLIVNSGPTAGAVHDTVRDELVKFLTHPGNRGTDWDDWKSLWNAFVASNRGQVTMNAPQHCRRCFQTRRDPRAANTRPCPACNGGQPTTIVLRSQP